MNMDNCFQFMNISWLERDQIQIAELPNEKGSYLLVFSLEKPKTVIIPRFKLVSLQPGLYGYIGSACGPGGLCGRLKHHLLPPHHPHWHIDWLRPALDWVGILYTLQNTPMECRWVQKLIGQVGAACPIPGFGASDCRNGCCAHLVFSPKISALADWHAALLPGKEENGKME